MWTRLDLIICPSDIHANLSEQRYYVSRGKIGIRFQTQAKKKLECVVPHGNRYPPYPKPGIQIHIKANLWHCALTNDLEMLITQGAITTNTCVPNLSTIHTFFELCLHHSYREQSGQKRIKFSQHSILKFQCTVFVLRIWLQETITYCFYLDI